MHTYIHIYIFIYLSANFEFVDPILFGFDLFHLCLKCLIPLRQTLFFLLLEFGIGNVIAVEHIDIYIYVYIYIYESVLVIHMYTHVSQYMYTLLNIGESLTYTHSYVYVEHTLTRIDDVLHMT